MSDAIAIVGLGAILPDAPDTESFWRNVTGGHYAIGEVDPARWDPELYYDPDPKAPERTYSKIGGWVRDWDWDPLRWKLPIPPKVSDAMDDAQKWAVACTRMALMDYGWPERPLDLERTAVVLGNALSGEKHYLTALRVTWPELERELRATPAYAALAPDVRAAVAGEMHERLEAWLPEVTEDTMPGELGNCLAGRVANLFNLRGPNFVVDAACASAMAAMDASIEGLVQGEFDAVVTGGIDRNMGASTFIKFCAIGALSGTGTRPYADGADGFVMGEGAALFVLKRLDDAERDGDRVYAVVRGIAGSSDGRGKGLTAPNPVGQKLAVRRAWAKSGVAPSACTMVEGHGTSTRVGDVVEVESLQDTFGSAGLAPGSVALGSVKSNIGHLKGAAGAAGLLKTALSLHHKVLPPSLNFERPNPNVDWAATPFAVNRELREWEPRNGDPRVAGVSAFGFGGTNFHAVLEEHVPGRLTNGNRSRSIAVPADVRATPAPELAGSRAAATPTATARAPKAPLRGALVLGADTAAGLAEQLRAALDAPPPEPAAPREAVLRAPERLAIDFGDAEELGAKGQAALKALDGDAPATWKALRGRGIFRGSGTPGKVAFLYTGQGSQYANMLAGLRRDEPIVRDVFETADRVMRPLLGGGALTDVIFVDPADSEAVGRATGALMRTEITQPAVLTVDIALTRLLAAYGIEPDLVMGHSLGEYGALVAAGVLSFEEALEAVSARGAEMASLHVEDPGAMAAVSAPPEVVEEIVGEVDGYAVLANVNSTKQVVLGGATAAVDEVVERLAARGHDSIRLPVSHAFHTSIVAPASEPLRRMLRRLTIRPPRIPVVANVDGELYPEGDGVEERIVDILGRQVASPVQFVKGLRTLWDHGARVFVETGPKRALQGFASDVLGDEKAMNLMTNHPKLGDAVSFNHALCGLWASGVPAAPPTPVPADVPASSDETLLELGRILSDALQRGRALVGDGRPGGPPETEPAVITGASLGLPGTDRLFDEANLARLLHGEQLIDVIPSHVRQEILDKHITRLRKGDDGSAGFEEIDSVHDVVKLAARAGRFDLASEFGVDADRVGALGRDTQLAIAAGIDALRDAGIPLVLHYKTTTTGSRLPERWALPASMRDDTGVVFASAFPGFDELVDEVNRSWQDRSRREQIASLEHVRARLVESGAEGTALDEVDHVLHDLRLELDEHPYRFDRRFLFRVLSMGHSQFAELIGARGPNTQINAACASTTQAVALAEDWIRAGRCRRVVVVAADDATSDEMLPWIGAGFLASGAAATDEVVEDAALPFDQRRHGMLLGMGAAGLVVESASAAAERGVAPICEVLGTVTANSAFHGTRLDVEHIGGVMEEVVAQAEARGVRRGDIAGETVFVSHETYTPARGGSAAAEIHALRQVFGADADKVVIANTKGYTGHPMGVGIEDVVAVKALETGLVPAVPNFRDADPDLGSLHLSQGGRYPVRFALRLAAGFGSQISMMLLRWTPTVDGRRREPEELGFSYRVVDEPRWTAWLRAASGQEAPELEVVQHRLRVVDGGAAAAPAAPPRETATAMPLGVADIADGAAKEVAPLAEPMAAPATQSPATEPATGSPAAAAASGSPAASAATGSPAAEPATEAPAAPAGAPAPATTPATDEIEQRVLEVVAAETGYPTDLLELDLDLEADLGIDTVKQAEVFAAIRDSYGIERDDSLKLRDYPTLNHVVGFVRDRAGNAAAAAAAPTAEPASGSPAAEPASEPPAAVPASGPPAAEPATKAPAAVAATGSPAAEPASGSPAAAPAAREAASGRFPRRVPVPVLRPPLDRCVATGVELGAGTRVLVVPDTGGVAEGLVSRLEERGAEVVLPGGATDAVNGVFWLPALDADPEDWRAGLDQRVKRLAETMRELDGAFLVSATRLGGRHGYDAAGAESVMGGAVSGFTKALAREREQTLVKVVDTESGCDAATVAGLLLDEALRDPGAVEVGHADGLRWTVGLEERPASADPARDLTPETTFIVTGAAGSIVSAITADLATAAGGGTFHLLDLVPAPDRDDPDLARFTSDKDGLKRDLADRLREQGERPTPKLVERELARIERALAATDALAAIEAAGGIAHWHQVDLTDEQAVAAAVGGAGHIDVLVHAGGLEISHVLPDKTQREFDLVFDVKVGGWYALMSALAGDPPGTAVVFSSIAGRFGNGGQTDYAAANDLLCKAVAHMRRGGPTRGVAIDWTAWAGIGMATRGSIPKMMELAGIDMLPPEEGIPVVRRELTCGGDDGEVLVAGALGILLAERHDTGGLDVALGAAGPMTGEAKAMTAQGELVVHTELDPSRQAFLDDHRIDGTAVLPGVMGMEGFAEAANALLPGWHVSSIEDVELLAPFKFYRDEPRAFELRTRLADGGDGTILADCRLIGRRTVKTGEQETVHFTGRARLNREAPEAPVGEPPEAHEGVGRDDVYRVYFHGPAYQVLESAWRDDGHVVGRLAEDLPPDHEPPNAPLVMVPRLVELCFQTAGVHELGTQGRMALPTHVDRVTMFTGAGDAGPLHAIVTPRDVGVDADVVDGEGRVRVRLEGYRTTALPGELDAATLEPIRRAMM